MNINQTYSSADPNPALDQLRADLSQWHDDMQTLADSDDLFKIRSANQWLEEAGTLQTPKMLFGKLWYEGELCILFADSNLGKSILAVQIANSINQAIPIGPFELEAERQAVLYYDFELNSKQFETRYSNEFKDRYHFRDDLYRGQLNDMEMPDGVTNFNQYLHLALERSINQTKAKVVIIDNITYLGTENEQAKDALPLMKQLKALKNKYDLSILVLAHTPKRDMTMPITRNDLQGSKMLMNFCDSSFAIGESQLDNNLRYIKQIKQRNTEEIYGADNVCLCTITKPNNFLKYEFVSYGQEWEHLKTNRHVLSTDLIDKALELRQDGKSIRESAKVMGISYQKVARLLKAAERA